MLNTQTKQNKNAAPVEFVNDEHDSAEFNSMANELKKAILDQGGSLTALPAYATEDIYQLSKAIVSGSGFVYTPSNQNASEITFNGGQGVSGNSQPSLSSIEGKIVSFISTFDSLYTNPIVTWNTFSAVLKNFDGAPLDKGQIKIGMLVSFFYDGTGFTLVATVDPVVGGVFLKSIGFGKGLNTDWENKPDNILQNRMGEYTSLQTALAGYFYDVIGHGFRTEVVLGSESEILFNAPLPYDVGSALAVTSEGVVAGFGGTGGVNGEHITIFDLDSENQVEYDATGIADNFFYNACTSLDGTIMFATNSGLPGTGGARVIVKSVDRGVTWTVAYTLGVSQEVGNIRTLSNGVVVATGFNANVGGFTEEPFPVYSEDNGATWAEGTVVDAITKTSNTLGALEIGFDIVDGTYIFCSLGSISEAALAFTAPALDGIWTSISVIVPAQYFIHSLFVDYVNQDVYVGAQKDSDENILRKSSDGGATWTTAWENNVTDGIVIKMVVTPDRVFYLLTRDGIVHRSVDAFASVSEVVDYSANMWDIVYSAYSNSLLLIKFNSTTVGFQVESIDIQREYGTGTGTPIKQRFYNGVFDVFVGGATTVGGVVKWGLSALSVAKNYIGILRDSNFAIDPSDAPLGSLFRNTLDTNRLCERGLDGSIGRVGYTTLLNVELFGANPNAIAEINRIAIQNAIDFAESSVNYSGVFIPPKTYEIDEYLTIGSNSRLVGATGATLKAENLSMDLLLTNKNTLSGGGYTGDKNITIENIIFDANRTITGQDITIIGIAHATNVKIINCSFTAWSEWHAIEYNACSDSSIIGCKFYDAIQSDLNEEAIQLDLITNSIVFPWPSGVPYDNTPCKNITIADCTFENVSTGIGCHNFYADTPVDGVIIRDCVFNTIKYRCVSAYNWKNLLVTGCTVYDAERFVNYYGVGLTTPGIVSGIKVINNSIELVQYGLNVDQDGAINVDGVTDGVIFSNNVLKNITKVANNSRALWVQGEAASKIFNVVAIGNTVDVASQYGITADFCVNPIFSGNKVTGCEQSGIVMFSCTRGIISDNVLQDNNTGAGSYYDMDYYGGGDGGLLSGNNCETAHVDGTTNTYVTGNKIDTSLILIGGSNKSNANYLAGVWVI